MSARLCALRLEDHADEKDDGQEDQGRGVGQERPSDVNAGLGAEGLINCGSAEVHSAVVTYIRSNGV